MKPQAATCSVHLSAEVTPEQNFSELKKHESTIMIEQSGLLVGASPVWLFATVASDVIVVVA